MAQGRVSARFPHIGEGEGVIAEVYLEHEELLKHCSASGRLVDGGIRSNNFYLPDCVLASCECALSSNRAGVTFYTTNITNK
jgi:hypothetical protein